MASSDSSPLDVRKQDILKAVVVDYVRTAEPVGSQVLAVRYTFGVRSATIRNEMAELGEMGYLRQPHTSAGRIPSDQGYRFYVDRLMEGVSLSTAETRMARGRLPAPRSEVDVIIDHTCRLLSEISRYTALATRPALAGAAISHISVAGVGQDKVVLLMVLDDGRVFHELIEMTGSLKGIDPVKATSVLMRVFVGRGISSVAAIPMETVPADAAEMTDLLGTVVLFIKRRAAESQETEIHMEGASYIMQQPEFKDVDRLEAIMSVLEQRKTLYSLFSSVYLGPGGNGGYRLRKPRWGNARLQLRGRELPRAGGWRELSASSAPLEWTTAAQQPRSSSWPETSAN